MLCTRLIVWFDKPYFLCYNSINGYEKEIIMSKQTPEQRMQEALDFIKEKAGFKNHNAIIADNLEEFLAKAAEND